MEEELERIKQLEEGNKGCGVFSPGHDVAVDTMGS